MRRRFGAIPLRVGLVVALVALVAVGLVVSGVAVTTATDKSLTHRTDQQLELAAQSFARPEAPRYEMPPRAPRPARPPSQYYQLRKSAGGVLTTVVNDTVNGPPATPALPDPPSRKPTSVGSLNGSDVRWRVMTVSNDHGSTTIGLRLTDNDETVSRLIMFQVGIGAIVLMVIAVAAFFVIRRSLRPLREVEATAAAIAGGDLHRRVPVRGTDTEVDRLSQALNVMLGRIQTGVAATEASEEAARRSEAKMRRFVADASHELRTPLTTIRGFAELYRQGALTDPQTLMNRIESESARMGLLVEDLLMLARLDAQRPLDRRPVDLLELGGEAVHNARALAAENDTPDRRIGLEVVDGEGTLEIIGDRARLQQVLANLIGNALAHTPSDAVITVRLTPLAETVRVEVVDTGPGLSSDAAERVFERFYRTDVSRARSSGGTGLGLSIVQSLVEAHHGTVRVDSTPGEGATFIVDLPRGA